jgi:hypothetical protein
MKIIRLMKVKGRAQSAMLPDAALKYGQGVKEADKWEPAHIRAVAHWSLDHEYHNDEIHGVKNGNINRRNYG